MTRVRHQEIAIVGMACRFPGARTYEEFWENLYAGKESLGAIPEDRWEDPKAEEGSMPHRAGLLEDVWSFDNYFFKISPKEAVQIDPQQRILLEEVKHCIDDSGLPPDLLRAKKTSVFVGSMTNDYLVKGIEEGYPVDGYSCLGNYHCILANRVSHGFGFEGESTAVDAACASSLVALHSARRSLLSRESDFSIVAGANLICSPWKHRSFFKAGMLSGGGKCKTFDSQADGYVPGEGVGVLLLTRKDIAVRSGAKIYALLKGSCANHIGTGRSITAPSVRAQAGVIAGALRGSGVSPDQISYIEAHGTGTSLGDPIEVEALRRVFGETRKAERYVGSVKPNIGHLEGAAGIAGVIKVCLMMQHRAIPPSVNVTQVNPLVPFADGSLRLAREAAPWSSPEGPRSAGISSFGFGGVSSHVIVQEHVPSGKPKRESEGLEGEPRIFCLSAHSKSALSALVERYGDWLQQEKPAVSLADLCHTLTRGREAQKYRFGVVVKDLQELRAALDTYREEEIEAGARPLAVSLHGFAQGTRCEAVAGEIARRSPAFRSRHAANAARIAACLPGGERLDEFCLLLSLGQTLADCGARVALLSGSGTGFLAAACLSGWITLEDAVHSLRAPGEPVAIHPEAVRIPISLPGRREPVLPFEGLEGYWEQLVRQAMPDAETQEVYLERARLLYGPQRTFTNAMDRWLNSLGALAEDLRHALFSESVELAREHRLCLLVGIRLGLDEINDRWELSDRFEDRSRLPELARHASRATVGAEGIQRLILHGSGAETLQENLSRAWEKIDLADYPCLSAALVAAGGARAETLTVPPAGVPEMERNEAYQELVIGSAEIDATRFGELLLGLWKNGASIPWEQVWPEPGRPVAGLPAYPFDRIRYRYESAKPSSTARAVVAESQASAAPEVERAPAGADRLRARFTGHLLERIGKITRIPRERLEESTCFADIGLDSVIILELTRQLSEIFGTVPATLFFQHRDVRSLAEYFVLNHRDGLSRQFPEEATGLKESLVPQVSAILPEPGPGPTRQESVDAIAIIGVSGRYPGAKNLEELWELLRTGGQSVGEIPETRWAVDPGNARWGGFLEGVGEFDPAAFGISPREARFMTPQERLFLEEAYHCLDNAGYLKRLKEAAGEPNRIAVIVGATYNDYQLYYPGGAHGPDGVPVNAQSYSVANRVSYHFGLNGPSLVLDTACSSSLYAIHLACESLRSGESEAALAGGVNTSLHPSKYEMLASYGFLSADGRCRAFGEGGTGYVPSEGVGAVLLKPLARALSDGDPVYAVIRGSAVSHGGRTHGYTVPNPKAQAEAISRALERAAVDPRTVSYVEAHGTGTSLGDPIEVAGLTEVYRKHNQDRHYCAIGSIKSNLGHTEAAAGIAQVTKVLLQMKHGKLVPSLLHSSRVNPHIAFEETPFYVQQTLEDWKTGGAPRRAGISSFGAGGVNVHLILEEFDSRETGAGAPKDSETGCVIGLSAETPEQLTRGAQDLASYIQRRLDGKTFLQPLTLERVSATLLHHREARRVRAAFKARALEEVVSRLGHLQAGLDPGTLLHHEIYYSGEEGFRWFGGTPTPEDRLLIETLVAHGAASALAKLWAMGAPVDWLAAFPQFRELPPVYLPPHPFRKQRFWFPEGQRKEAPVASAPAAPKGLEPADRPEIPPRGEGFLWELADSPESLRLTMTADFLRETLARLLGFSSAREVRPEVGFFDMGVESMMLLSLKSSIGERFGIELPEATFFEFSSVNKLARKILESLDFDRLLEETSPAATPPRIEVSSAPRPAHEPVAILGMSCRLPGGACDPESFWRLLEDREETVSELPKSAELREAFESYQAANPGCGTTRASYLQEDTTAFDPRFFNVTPREARSMDPQQRLALELVWEAVERAGYNPLALPAATGVFVGVIGSEYGALARRQSGMDAYTATGSLASVTSGRISHFLNISGPSLSIDTACSSSLVALHMAFQSLRNGDCELALVGGLNLFGDPSVFLMLSEMQALAPDGRCKALSALANGYGRGEGGGFLLLKRLSDARRDGDQVLATIVASVLNHDGHSSGLTVPNGRAQADLLRAALAEAGIGPDDMDFIELHGTGTPLGDPIEVAAIEDAYTERRVAAPLLLTGSKPNIGHLEAAAGIVGVIKSALCLQKKSVPPFLLHGTLNPRIRLQDGKFAIAGEGSQLLAGKAAHFAGVSSFGFSGCNAHVILRGETTPRAEQPFSQDPELLCVSAKTQTGLASLLERYRKLLDDKDLSLKDLAHTANLGRAHFDHRIPFVARDLGNLKQQMDRFLVDRRVTVKPVGGASPGKFALYADGFVATAWNAGTVRSLCDRYATFRETIAEIEAMGPRLSPPDPLAVFACQLAMGRLLIRLAGRPDLFFGTGIGQVTIAVLIGSLDLREAVRLIQSFGAGGEGKRIVMTAEQAGNRPLVVFPGDTGVACQAEGAGEPVEGLCFLPAEGRHLTASLLERMKAPTEAVLSCETGELITARGFRQSKASLFGEVADFGGCLSTLAQHETRLIVGLSLGSAFWTGIRNSVFSDRFSWVSALDGAGEDPARLPQLLARLYREGREIDWPAWSKERGDQGRRIALPTYPFERKSYCVELSRTAAREVAPVAPFAGTLVPLDRPEKVVAFSIGTQNLPSAEDTHGILHVGLYHELVLAAAAQAFSGVPARLGEIRFHEPLVLNKDPECIQVVFTEQDEENRSRFSVHAMSSGSWVRYAEGRAVLGGAGALRIPAIEGAVVDGTEIPGPDFYALLKTKGVELGASVRWITRLKTGEGAVEGVFASPSPNPIDNGHLAFDATALDACAQQFNALACARESDEVAYMVESMSDLWHGEAAGKIPALCITTLTHFSAKEGRLSGSFLLLDETGDVLYRAGEVRMRGVKKSYWEKPGKLRSGRVRGTAARAKALPAELTADYALESLRETLGQLTELPANEIGPGTTLAALGCDSLMSLQLKRSLDSLFGIDFPLAQLSAESPLKQLAKALLEEKLGKAASRAPRPMGSWIRSFGRGSGESPGLQIYCFPYGGAGASVFQGWQARLQGSAEVHAIQLPGREERGQEAPATDIEALARTVAEAVAGQKEGPFAFYGHSAGALVAYATARALPAEIRPDLVHFFCGGFASPTRWPNRWSMACEEGLRKLGYEKGLDSLNGMGALKEEELKRLHQVFRLPFEFRGNEPIVRDILRILTADMKLLRSFRGGEDLHPLHCPVTVFCGKTDDRASVDEMRSWKALTEKDFSLVELEGDHFFMSQGQQEESLTGMIAAALAKTVLHQ